MNEQLIKLLHYAGRIGLVLCFIYGIYRVRLRIKADSLRDVKYQEVHIMYALCLFSLSCILTALTYN